METKIIINELMIGEGIPKICAPLTGDTVEALLSECKLIRESEADLVEWRVDFFGDALDENAVLKTLPILKEALQPLPLLFSFRTAKEGGEKKITADNYFMLNNAVVSSGYVELIDIELSQRENIVSKLIEVAKHNNVYTVVSSHDFDKTPTKEEMVAIMKKSLDLGANLPKLAVMPVNEEDVLTILTASLQLKREYPSRPMIMLAMGSLGLISRLSGEIFGSAITFGVAKRASAPGQIPIETLKKVLQLVHDAK